MPPYTPRRSPRETRCCSRGFSSSAITTSDLGDAVAVYREIAAESAETELLYERRLLTEAQTAQAVAQLEAYREQLEARVSEYLAEDLTAFLEGFSAMDQGLQSGDSDSVIRGNVVIQRVLGREPQFTNQQEFDDLMDSDIPLKL